MEKKFLHIIDFSKSSHAVLLLTAELFFGFLVVVGSLYGFLQLADEVLEKEIISFDATVANIITSFRSPPMTESMLFISYLGNAYFLMYAIIFMILFLWKTHKKDAVMFSFIFASAVGLNLFLKELFQRSRPLEALVNEPQYSFPSGHAMNSFVFYMALTYFVFWHMKNRKLGWFLSFLAVLLVILIGISRIYLGVHYPSDVLAGFLAGLCWLGIVILVDKTLLFFRLFRKFESEKQY
jgi:undecaprenyl-diphosphatase